MPRHFIKDGHHVVLCDLYLFIVILKISLFCGVRFYITQQFVLIIFLSLNILALFLFLFLFLVYCLVAIVEAALFAQLEEEGGDLAVWVVRGESVRAADDRGVLLLFVLVVRGLAPSLLLVQEGQLLRTLSDGTIILLSDGIWASLASSPKGWTQSIAIVKAECTW